MAESNTDLFALNHSSVENDFVTITHRAAFMMLDKFCSDFPPFFILIAIFYNAPTTY
jgi:hypothetical protein